MDTARPLLVLDVDETLVRTVIKPLPGRQPDFELDVPCDEPGKKFEHYYVYRRPHLEEFLVGSAVLFDVGIWTAGGADYIASLLPHITPQTLALKFVLSRQHCQPRRDLETQEQYFIKDLKRVKKLGFSLSRTLLVEDTPLNACRNFGNLVRVKPFLGDAGDDELLHLQKYLAKLHSQPNFRTVEKRGWRTRLSSN
jgi:TFIIF-interacting CTD phosphatase-like protein